ncbi:MAG: hypothetical protein OXG38_01220 [Chloroflexi bacterium]|nr:hypothetical protein [Chloroflexota bacterium]
MSPRREESRKRTFRHQRHRPVTREEYDALLQRVAALEEWVAAMNTEREYESVAAFYGGVG